MAKKKINEEVLEAFHGAPFHISDEDMNAMFRITNKIRAQMLQHKIVVSEKVVYMIADGFIHELFRDMSEELKTDDLQSIGREVGGFEYGIRHTLTEDGVKIGNMVPYVIPKVELDGLVMDAEPTEKLKQIVKDDKYTESDSDIY